MPGAITSIEAQLPNNSVVRNRCIDLPRIVLTAPAAGGKTLLLDALRSAMAMERAAHQIADGVRIGVRPPWSVGHQHSVLTCPLRDGHWTPSHSRSAQEPDGDLLEALWPRNKPADSRRATHLPIQERLLMNFACLLTLRRRRDAFPLVLDAPLSMLDASNAPRLACALEGECGQVIILERPERAEVLSSVWTRQPLRSTHV